MILWDPYFDWSMVSYDFNSQNRDLTESQATLSSSWLGTFSGSLLIYSCLYIITLDEVLHIILVTMMIKVYMCTPTGLLYVLPDNSTNASTSCPSQPCATLSQYIMTMSRMSTSNIKFLFLSGTHSLTSNITMQHVHNVTMVWVNYDNLAPSKIFCQSAEGIMVFVNSSNC